MLLGVFAPSASAISIDILENKENFSELGSWDFKISHNKRSFVVALKYARSDDVYTILKDVFEADLSSGRLSLSQSVSNNSIVIRLSESDDKELIQEIADVIDGIDLRNDQVLIDVLVVEITHSNEDSFDLEWKELFENPLDTKNSLINIAVDHGKIDLNNPTSSVNGLKAMVTSGNKMKAFLDVLQKNGKGIIVSSPHILTANHREAIFKTGEKLPLIESTRPSETGPINSYKVEEVGLELKVTPHINRNRDIDMKIFQSIDAVDSYDTKTYTARMKNRSAETNLTIKNKETVVLGGFIQNKEDKSESRVPLLSSLPVVGKLFRNTSISKSKTELLVFITPTIVAEPLDAENITRKMVAGRNSESKHVIEELLKSKSYKDTFSDYEVLIPMRSDNWMYIEDFTPGKEIAANSSNQIDVSKFDFKLIGHAPFGIGFSPSNSPSFVRTYFSKLSSFVALSREFDFTYPKRGVPYKSLGVKVASDNAAFVYLNGMLVDEDPFAKLKGVGHHGKYWNREVADIPVSYLKEGKNNIFILLVNSDAGSSSYFDFSLVGYK